MLEKSFSSSRDIKIYFSFELSGTGYLDSSLLEIIWVVSWKYGTGVEQDFLMSWCVYESIFCRCVQVCAGRYANVSAGMSSFAC